MRRIRRRHGPPFRYVPAHLLSGEPHVIVDGAARPGTAFTLSHWPGTPTPAAFDADLSAEMARLAVVRPQALPEQLEMASVDHYDVDGLVALGLLVLDGLEAAHGAILVEAARAGDFDVVSDRRAALIAFALNAVDDRHRGSGCTVPPEATAVDSFEHCGVVTQKALDLLVDLAGDPEAFEWLWGEEWSAYEASVQALAEGWATIEERPELDLAVVRVSPHRNNSAAMWKSSFLHRAAVHSATDCLRVVTLAEGHLEMRYRYESWVRLVSRRPRPRVDLERLANDLTAREKASARWMFDGAGAITGALHLAGDDDRTTIEPGQFVDMVCAELEALDQGPAAWDPYRSR